MINELKLMGKILEDEERKQLLDKFSTLNIGSVEVSKLGQGEAPLFDLLQLYKALDLDITRDEP